MSATLKTSNITLIPHLEIADTFFKRTKGLLGRMELPLDHALWIQRCNSIHTFFMKFPIDLIFINNEMIIQKTMANIEPSTLILPVFGASSVIECSHGFLDKFSEHLKNGQKLYVDHSVS